MTDIQNIALRHLTLSEKNVRTTRSKEAIAALAANILANDLIHQLHVHTQDEGMYGVVVGGTRLAALQLLLKEKKITEDYQVPCEVHSENDPKLAEISLAENVVRTDMSPADEFLAFSSLIGEGKGPAEVGAQFGKTSRYVQQRMRLAAVSPKLIAAFRKDEMSLDQIEAFTVEPDHKKQEKIWKSLSGWQKERGDGDIIRAALTEQHVATDSPIAKFVGLENYRAAGGSISADLFDHDPDAGYITNPVLLDKLVGEKLATEAAKLADENWKWTQTVPVLTWEDAEKYHRLRPKRADPTPEAQAEIERLEAEAAEIQELHGEHPEDEEAANRLDAIGERYDELTQGEAVWSDEQNAVAGVILTIDREGNLDIRRGMVKPEDKSAAKKLDKALGKGGDTDEPEAPAKPKGGLPASLIAELTSHKTVAAQLVLATKPDAALLAVTHALTIQTLYAHAYGSHSALKITANEPTYPMAIRESVEKSAPAKKLAALVKATQKKLPKKPELLWAWLEAQTPATLRGILAVAAALTVDVVQSNGAEATPAAVALAKTIKLDPADHWEATAENYFTRVPKKHLLAELNGVLKPTTLKSIETMKKEPMAKTLQTELKGKRWIPAVLKVG